MTTPLHRLARVIRSKNAGPYELTLDILFDSQQAFETVRDSGALTEERVASLYGIPSDNVLAIIAFAPARAIKITLIRPTVSGAVVDTDVYGAQQHAPLLDLPIPTEEDSTLGES